MNETAGQTPAQCAMTHHAQALRTACKGAIKAGHSQRSDPQVKTAARACALATGNEPGLDLEAHGRWESACKAGSAGRHRDAILIYAGACNPSGIAHTLADACLEVEAEGGAPENDPAVCLVVSQISWLIDCRAPETG